MPVLEFTIRNKAKNPILTFKPETLKMLLGVQREVSQLVIGKYCQAYKQDTGRTIAIDHEQHLALLAHYGADERGTWVSEFSKMGMPWFMVERCFRDGFLMAGFEGFAKELVTAQAFYGLLATQLKSS